MRKMAAIRSHFISLFSGGIFPDKKWWLSCFCLSHSKEEKSRRQSSRQSDDMVYTIHTNQDEDNQVKIDFLSCLETDRSFQEEEPQNSNQSLYERPLTNECQTLILDSRRLTKHQKYTMTNDNCEAHGLSQPMKKNLGVAPESLSLTFNSDSRSLPETGVLVISSDYDKLCKEKTNSDLTDSERFPCKNCLDSDIFIHGIFHKSKYIIDSSLQKINEDGCSSRNVLKPSSEFTDGSFVSPDLVSKISSDLETSGIQSSSLCYEDSTLQLNSSYDNSCESIDETDISIQTATLEPISSQICEKQSSSFESGLHQSHGNKTPQKHGTVESDNQIKDGSKILLFSTTSSEMPAYESQRNSEIKSLENSTLLSLCVSSSFEDITSETNHCHDNRLVEKSILEKDHAYCAMLVGKYDQQRRLPESFHLKDGSSQNAFECDFIDKIEADLADIDNKVDDKMTVTTLTDIWFDDQNSFSKAEGETIPMLFAARERDIDDHCISVMPKESLKTSAACCNTANCDSEAESEAFVNGNRPVLWNVSDIMSVNTGDLASRLQVKLLFRSDSYDMFEQLVREQTESLFKETLDQLLSIRGVKENICSWNCKDSLTNCSLLSMPHESHEVSNQGMNLLKSFQDPFLLSAFDVFEDVLTDNYEQLFNNEEWLDDDFGFSSSTEANPPPPYPDRVINEYEYSKKDFLPDIAFDDNSLQPDWTSFVIQLTPENIFPLVDQVANVFWSSRRYGEPWSEVRPPETYFTSEDYYGTLDDCSRKSHKTFMFDLVAEILQEIYSDELNEVSHPWQKVCNFRPKHIENPPTTIDVLKPLVRCRILKILEKGQELSSDIAKRGTARKRHLEKQDFVDKLLVREMYQEEAGWTDYSQDANMIKDRVANKLLLLLIEDTVAVLNKICSNDASS